MNDTPYGAGLPAPQDQIFLPVETISQRIIDAEKKRDEFEQKYEKIQDENDSLRRQRSRSVLLALVFGVAFLTTAMGVLFAAYWANQQVKDARAQTETAEEAVKAAELERDQQIGDMLKVRTELNELDEFQEISDLRIVVANSREKLDNLKKFYAKETGDAELKKIFDRQPEPWSVKEGDPRFQAATWESGVIEQLTKEFEFYDNLLKDIEVWRIKRGQAMKSPQTCTRSNPWQPETQC